MVTYTGTSISAMASQIPRVPLVGILTRERKSVGVGSRPAEAQESLRLSGFCRFEGV